MAQTEEMLLTLTADIVAAHVSNKAVAVGDVPTLVRRVHDALKTLGEQPEAQEESRPEPKVSIRSSVRPDHLVCLIDGTKHKMLKRHLARAHDLTPQQYREQFGPRPDYPMVAPNYAEQRRDLAKKIGLGAKRRREGAGNGARKGR
jgi:predicted transcriptional regulator